MTISHWKDDNNTEDEVEKTISNGRENAKVVVLMIISHVKRIMLKIWMK